MGFSVSDGSCSHFGLKGVGLDPSRPCAQRGCKDTEHDKRIRSKENGLRGGILKATSCGFTPSHLGQDHLWMPGRIKHLWRGRSKGVDTDARIYAFGVGED